MHTNASRHFPLRRPSAGGAFDATITHQLELTTSLGTFQVSTTEGRYGWPVAGSRCWLAQLHADDPGLEEVGDAFGMTESEALDVLARALVRYGGAARDRNAA